MPSYEEIFAELYRSVLYFFRKKGFPPLDAEDLTQEVFKRVYQHLEDLNSSAALRVWVFEIAKNVWRNWLRDRTAQKRAHQEVAIDEMEESPARSPESLVNRPQQEDQVLEAERRKHLRKALNELPPRMRQCILLRIERDLKYREIAEILGIKIDTVKAQIHQAKEILKKKLGPDFEPPDGEEGD